LKWHLVTYLHDVESSPPSRAAWIEITPSMPVINAAWSSPPSRAAWIEIHKCRVAVRMESVAAFTGGVD